MEAGTQGPVRTYRDEGLCTLKNGLELCVRRGLFTDITIVHEEGRKFSCHQIVLSACSPRLRVVLENGQLHNSELHIQSVPEMALEALLNFFYTGEAVMSFPEVFGLCKAADRLEVTCLAEACRRHITAELRPETTCVFIEHALTHSLAWLTDMCMESAVRWFDSIALCRSFTAASFRVLETLLLHCRAFVSADDLFGASWIWIMSDISHFRCLEFIAKLVPLPASLTLDRLLQMRPLVPAQREAYEELMIPEDARQCLEALIVKVWPSLAASRPTPDAQRRVPTDNMDRHRVQAPSPPPGSLFRKAPTKTKLLDGFFSDTSRRGAAPSPPSQPPSRVSGGRDAVARTGLGGPPPGEEQRVDSRTRSQGVLFATDRMHGSGMAANGPVCDAAVYRTQQESVANTSTSTMSGGPILEAVLREAHCPRSSGGGHHATTLDLKKWDTPTWHAVATASPGRERDRSLPRHEGGPDIKIEESPGAYGIVLPSPQDEGQLGLRKDTCGRNERRCTLDTGLPSMPSYLPSGRLTHPQAPTTAFTHASDMPTQSAVTGHVTTGCDFRNDNSTGILAVKLEEIATSLTRVHQQQDPLASSSKPSSAAPESATYDSGSFQVQLRRLLETSGGARADAQRLVALGNKVPPGPSPASPTTVSDKRPVLPHETGAAQAVQQGHTLRPVSSAARTSPNVTGEPGATPDSRQGSHVQQVQQGAAQAVQAAGPSPGSTSAARVQPWVPASTMPTRASGHAVQQGHLAVMHQWLQAPPQVPAKCQVQTCAVLMRSIRERQDLVCTKHTKATSVLVDGLVQRFCHQCRKFHTLDAFDGAKWTCRWQLADERKRKRQREDVGAPDASAAQPPTPPRDWIQAPPHTAASSSPPHAGESSSGGAGTRANGDKGPGGATPRSGSGAGDSSRVGGSTPAAASGSARDAEWRLHLLAEMAGKDSCQPNKGGRPN